MAIVFVDGELLHPETMAAVPTTSVRRADCPCFHDNAVFGHPIDVFQMLRDYTKIARDLKTPMPERLERCCA